MLPLCYKDPTSGEGTVSPRHVITSIIYIFIAFLNRYRQAEVVCITIYLKLLIIDRETNQQSSTGSNVGLVPWGHAKPGSDADNVPLLLHGFYYKSNLKRRMGLFKRLFMSIHI